MHLLKLHPKRASWTLHINHTDKGVELYAPMEELRDENGYLVFVTRTTPEGHQYREYPLAHQQYPETNNVIVSARLQYAGASRGRSSALQHFKDVDTNKTYVMGVDATGRFIQAVQDGKIKVSDNTFEGTFTFAKQGDQISLIPYLEE